MKERKPAGEIRRDLDLIGSNSGIKFPEISDKKDTPSEEVASPVDTAAVVSPTVIEVDWADDLLALD